MRIYIYVIFSKKNWEIKTNVSFSFADDWTDNNG